MRQWVRDRMVSPSVWGIWRGEAPRIVHGTVGRRRPLLVWGDRTRSW
jgi:hypothetical protein